MLCSAWPMALAPNWTIKSNSSKRNKATVVRADGQEKVSVDGELLLVFAPHPDHNMNSFRAFSQCDGVVFVERYGVTRHKDVDKITEFLRNQNINLLGVIGLND